MNKICLFHFPVIHFASVARLQDSIMTIASQSISYLNDVSNEAKKNRSYQSGGNSLLVNEKAYEINLSDSEESKNAQLLSIPQAMFLMVNSTLGAGLLSFPIAYSYAGGAVQGLLLQAVGIEKPISSLAFN